MRGDLQGARSSHPAEISLLLSYESIVAGTALAHIAGVAYEAVAVGVQLVIARYCRSNSPQLLLCGFNLCICEALQGTTSVALSAHIQHWR